MKNNHPNQVEKKQARIVATQRELTLKHDQMSRPMIYGAVFHLSAPTSQRSRYEAVVKYAIALRRDLFVQILHGFDKTEFLLASF